MLHIGRGSLKLLKRSLKGLVQKIRKMAVKKTIIKQQMKMSCLRHLEYRSWCLVSICRLHPFSRMLWRKTSFLRYTSQIFFILCHTHSFVLNLILVFVQIPLFNILTKFDGKTVTEVVRPCIARMRYRVIRLPKYLILHMRRFTKNNFFMEKNPTIGTWWIQFSPPPPPNSHAFSSLSIIYVKNLVRTT